jgi:DNA invertase Pin-like site-specific DNA recombinase
MPPKSSSKSVKTKTAAPNFKTIGYLRVSTGDQELEKNKSDILHLANHLSLGQISFVEEIVSGKVSWKKRKIAEIIAEFQKGDTLIVSELSRLGEVCSNAWRFSRLQLKKVLGFMPSKVIGHSTPRFKARSWRWLFRLHRKSNAI